MRNKLFALTVGTALALCAGGCSQDAELPIEAMGTWVTNAPRYAGRSFSLTRERFSVGTAEGTSHHKIQRIRTTTEGRRDLSRDYRGRDYERAEGVGFEPTSP